MDIQFIGRCAEWRKLFVIIYSINCTFIKHREKTFDFFARPTQNIDTFDGINVFVDLKTRQERSEHSRRDDVSAECIRECQIDKPNHTDRDVRHNKALDLEESVRSHADRASAMQQIENVLAMLLVSMATHRKAAPAPR